MNLLNEQSVLFSSREVNNMADLQAIAVIIGLVNGIKLFKENRESFIYFCVALGIGVGFGLLGFYGFTVESGILAALASSGLYKVATKLGGSQ